MNKTPNCPECGAQVGYRHKDWCTMKYATRILKYFLKK